jgi:hypothetical protein
LVLLSSPPVAAEDAASEIDVLKQQLEEQAAIIDALRTRLEEVEARQDAQESQPPATTPEPDNEDTRPAVRGRYPMDLYGYIKLDAGYDTGGANTGNFVRWVDPDDGGRDDDQFSVTARQTRLGVSIKGPELAGATTRGKVEVDFYGSGGEDKPELRMRHAYFTMNWPERDLEALFGQTWDLMSPLIPRNLNFTNLWWTGNLGFRRPQARVTKGYSVGENGRISLALATTRTIGDPDFFAFGEDTGTDAGFPTIQGRAAYSFKGIAGEETSFGLSGHYGEEEHDFTTLLGGTGHRDVKSWSVSAEAHVPVAKKVLIEGEVWTGANLDAYVGGIGQGVVVVPFEDGRFRYVRAIRSRGGWIHLDAGPFKKWRIGLGAGIDDPEDDDLLVGQRSRNIGIFANAVYSVRENLDLGLEVLHWQTDYKDRDDADSLRLQGSAVFKF